MTAAAVCFALLTGCDNVSPTSDVTSQRDNNQVQNENSDNVYFDRIAQLGFDKKLMEDEGDLVIYDGDIAFQKADFEKTSGLAKATQRMVSSLISTANAGNIRLKIHSSMSGWTTVIYSAVNAWNASGHSTIHISIVTSSPELTIYADSASACPSGFKNLSSNTCGRGAYCVNNNVGPTVSINLDAGYFPDDAQKIYLITHEIGHTLGLAHTNETEGSYIGTTLVTDNMSVMLGGDCGASKTLSPYDKKALSCLYPAPSSTAFVRYWNPTDYDHFYSRGTSEIGLGALGYTYESVEGVVFASATGYATAPLYRFYHSVMRDHFYSTNYNEGINAGYAYEGVVGYVSTSAQTNYLPLYRYWNASRTDHFYTTNPIEGGGDWAYEGVACYIYSAF
jgi:hypothetical protein